MLCIDVCFHLFRFWSDWRQSRSSTAAVAPGYGLAFTEGGHLQFPLMSLAPTTNQEVPTTNASTGEKTNLHRLCGRGSRLSSDPIFSLQLHRQRISTMDRNLRRRCSLSLTFTLLYPCITFLELRLVRNQVNWYYMLDLLHLRSAICRGDVALSTYSSLFYFQRCSTSKIRLAFMNPRTSHSLDERQSGEEHWQLYRAAAIFSQNR